MSTAILFAFTIIPVHFSLQVGSAITAVSPSRNLGFVVFLVSEDMKRLCPISISKRDTEAVVSAEACTILQLLQGIDTATAIFPANALHKAFGRDDGMTLSAVCVDLYDQIIDNNTSTEFVPRCDQVMAARKAPALVSAVKKLGLQVSEEEAAEPLLKYSINGELSQIGFKTVLNALRDETTPTENVFKTSLLSQDGAQVTVRPFEAMAFAIRYKVPFRIDPTIFYHDLAFDIADARTQFPLLTTVTVLQVQALRLEAQSRELTNQAASIVASAFGPRRSTDNFDFMRQI